ncbi:MAG: hypothetical protein KDI88_08685 [Gammaproteobacteria bacterium]|nr:hypothetical protein [Gammaproteobacteria bacterium]
MRTKQRSRKGKLNRIGRRRRNIRIGLLAATIALVGLLVFQLRDSGMVPANQPADVWFEAEQRPVELVTLPADDAAHDNYTEWWYYNGHLDTQDGRQFSFHYVIFVINRMAGHTVVHASFVDHATGRHFTAQRRTAGKPNDGLENAFDFDFSDWKMSGSGGQDRLVIDTPDFNFDLALENVNPPVLHGRTGLLDFKQAGSSYYYSRPRMRVAGTAGIDGNSQLVSGEAWFDHQWGDFRVTALAWNWFAVQLDDGRDLMLFELFTPEGKKVVLFGTLSGKGMEDVILDETGFKVTVTDYWYSEQTRINYPMGWKVQVPGHNVNIALEPVIREAEFDGRDSSYLIYWEGPVRVTGSQGGRGYIEMSGYQPSERRPAAESSRAQEEITLIDNLPSTAAGYPKPAIVTADNSNVRAGPGMEFAVIANLASGREVDIVAASDEWYRIDLGERQPAAQMWIHQTLVNPR